ncbi:MAG: prepilin-type N-terminal cleavage/methylation domain-containing protein [Patescibacteria group bacterium]
MKTIKGFTLIELLVVSVIILTFSGIILAQYNQQTQQLKFKNEAKKMIDIMELARKKAITSDLIPTPNVTPPTFCTDFTGYQFILKTNSSYSLNYCCNSSCITVLNTYNLDSKIVITSPVALPDSLVFTPLMKVFNRNFTSITLKNTVLNKCLVISISPIGVIELDENLTDCL